MILFKKSLASLEILRGSDNDSCFLDEVGSANLLRSHCADYPHPVTAQEWDFS